MNHTIEPSRYENNVTVYKWDVYPSSSVLAGQDRKVFVDTYPDAESALADYPDAEVLSGRRSAHNNFHHLPDEDGNIGPSPHDLDYGINPLTGELLDY